jgi:hypothetical protein
MHLERCRASRNGYGIIADVVSGTATVRVSNRVITNNDEGISGSTIPSRGNSTLENNGSGNTFPASYTAK